MSKYYLNERSTMIKIKKDYNVQIWSKWAIYNDQNKERLQCPNMI